MAGKDIIMLKQKELKRLHVIHHVLEKRMTQSKAAEVSMLSERQIRRIAQRIRKEGDKGIIHKSKDRALKELGVELIHAYSPQAKGRIERLFKTLQDRLVKELRLSKESSFGGSSIKPDISILVKIGHF